MKYYHGNGQYPLFLDLSKPLGWDNLPLSTFELVAKGLAKETYLSQSGLSQEVKILSSAVIPLKYYRTDCCFGNTPENIRFNNVLFPSSKEKGFSYDYPIFMAKKHNERVKIVIFSLEEAIKAMSSEIDPENDLDEYGQKNIEVKYFDKNAEEKKATFAFFCKNKFSFKIPLSYFLPECHVSDEVFQEQTFAEKKLNFFLYKKFQYENDRNLYYIKENGLVSQRYMRDRDNPLSSTLLKRDDLYVESDTSGYFLPYGWEYNAGLFWRKWNRNGESKIESFYENYDPISKAYIEYENNSYNQIEFFLRFEEIKAEAKKNWREKCEKIQEEKFEKEKRALSEKEEAEKFLNFFIENPNEVLEFADSKEFAGNCETGTREFLKKFDIKLVDEKISLKELFENPEFEKFSKNENFRRIINNKFFNK